MVAILLVVLRLHSYLPNSNILDFVNNAAIGHDAAGNRISDKSGNRTFTYNEAGRLWQVYENTALIATYKYNGLGQRVKKVTSTTMTYYHYDFNGKVIAELNLSGQTDREYVYLDGRPVAQFDTSSVTYLHTDHLGTPRRGTNIAGALVWSWEGNGFGDSLPSGLVTVNLRFPGQYYDKETGLHYNYFRDYDPSTGRYVESDPLGAFGMKLSILKSLNPSLSFSQDINSYVYASNNPLHWIDPPGLWSITFGGYYGWGGQVSFGRDPKTGEGFLKGRVGLGLGGGISWDPNGGRPGSSEECKSGGYGVGGFGDLGFNIGPLQAGVGAVEGVNYDNNGNENDYFPGIEPSWGFGDSWGIHAGGAIGGEVTIYN